MTFNYLLARADLIDQLARFVQHPELIADAYTREKFERRIDDYCLALAELVTSPMPPSELPPPDEPPVLDAPAPVGLIEEVEPQEPEIAMAGTLEEPDRLEVFEEVEPVEPLPLTSLEVLTHMVPDLIDALEGSEMMEPLRQLELLELWSARCEYHVLDAAQQHQIAHYITAKIRQVQCALGSMDLDIYKPRFVGLVKKVLEHFKTQGAVEFVYGLRLQDKPAHGARWEDDARHWRELLLAQLGIEPEQVLARTSTPLPLVPSSVEAELEEVDQDESEELPMEFLELVGRRMLLVGGRKSTRQLKQFNAWFSPESIKWVNSERKKGVRHVQSVCKKIMSGKFDVVCLLLRAASHAECGMIFDTAKKSGTNVHILTLEKGFGKTAWIDAIKRATPPFLHQLSDGEA